MHVHEPSEECFQINVPYEQGLVGLQASCLQSVMQWLAVI